MPQRPTGWAAGGERLPPTAPCPSLLPTVWDVSLPLGCSEFGRCGRCPNSLRRVLAVFNEHCLRESGLISRRRHGLLPQLPPGTTNKPQTQPEGGTTRQQTGSSSKYQSQVRPLWGSNSFCEVTPNLNEPDVDWSPRRVTHRVKTRSPTDTDSLHCGRLIVAGSYNAEIYNKNYKFNSISRPW